MATSACYGYKDNGVYVAAASNAFWNNRTACGKTFLVNCIGGTGTNLAPQPCSSLRVFIKIVDYCPRCGLTINISKDAFVIIANLDSRKVKINFEPDSVSLRRAGGSFDLVKIWGKWFPVLAELSQIWLINLGGLDMLKWHFFFFNV